MENMEYDTSMTPRPSAINRIRSAFKNRNRRRLLIALVVGLIFLLIVAAIVVVTIVLLIGPGSSDIKVSCEKDELRCADGQQCIPSFKHCDGNNDCGDSSDETNCTTTSPPTLTPTTAKTPTSATVTTSTSTSTTVTTSTSTPTNATTSTGTPQTTSTATRPTGPTTATPAGEQRCVLLIGANSYVPVPLIEYYHPTMDECDTDAIGTMSTQKIDITSFTSGCYLSDTQQITIREGGGLNNKPPMLYGLKDLSAKQLPFPPTGEYIEGTTAASISPTRCLSCGGSTADDRMKECYQFDSSSPTEWTSIPSLPTRLVYSASVSMDNGKSYYVIGGWTSKQVFRYSVSERRWYEETPMNAPRARHSAAALSATEFIVCGGEYDRNDCEVYNTMQKKWRPVGNLNTGRYLFVMRSFNGIVYAVGGVSDSVGMLDSVEAYNVQSEKWTEVKKLKNFRSAFVAVVV